MRLLAVLVPLVGTCVVTGVPIARYAEKQRDEAAIVAALHHIQAAQEQFHAQTGAYAAELASLVEPCPGAVTRLLQPEVLEGLQRADYELVLRKAEDAVERGRDCQGRSTASDYYVAAAPAHAWTAAGKGYAGRSDGRLFVFVDGVAPREADMTRGLATTIEALESFKIP